MLPMAPHEDRRPPATLGSGATSNPFPRMSEIDPTKEKNVFETRVTECQTVGGSAWD